MYCHMKLLNTGGLLHKNISSCIQTVLNGLLISLPTINNYQWFEQILSLKSLPIRIDIAPLIRSKIYIGE